jgi:hypothetical protein
MFKSSKINYMEQEKTIADLIKEKQLVETALEGMILGFIDRFPMIQKLEIETRVRSHNTTCGIVRSIGVSVNLTL